DRVVDPGEVLLDDRTGAEIEVADLGVPHLAVRKAHVATRGGQGRVRIRGPELVEVRRLRLRDRVARAIRRQAPAVQDDQRQRGQGEAWGAGGRRAHGAESTIAAKSRGSRLAPPTRAPSTSGCPTSSAAFSGLTEPP